MDPTDLSSYDFTSPVSDPASIAATDAGNLYSGLDTSALGVDTQTTSPGYGLQTPNANNSDFGSYVSNPADLYAGLDTSAITGSGLTSPNQWGLPSSGLDFGSLGALIGSAATTGAIQAANLRQLQLATPTTRLTTGGVLSGGNGESVILLAAVALVAFLVLARK